MDHVLPSGHRHQLEEKGFGTLPCVLSAAMLQQARDTIWDYKPVLDRLHNRRSGLYGPPYQGICGHRASRYPPRCPHKDFCHEWARLHARNVKFVVSYDVRTGSKTTGRHCLPR